MRNNAHSSKRFDRYLHPYPKKEKAVEREICALHRIGFGRLSSFLERTRRFVFFVVPDLFFSFYSSNPKFFCVCETLKFLSPFFTLRAEREREERTQRRTIRRASVATTECTLPNPRRRQDYTTRSSSFFSLRERKYGGSSSSGSSARD
jgi:hypothetical protein